MRLSRSYQPRTLDEVVGQPAVIRRLKRLVVWPQPSCLLFTGLGGIGKSATAKALIQDMGVCPFSGLLEYSASNLNIEEVRRLFGHTFRLRPMAANPWHVLLIEELELIVSRHVNAALKDELSEQHMPERLIVVATSNDASGLDEALLQRFRGVPLLVRAELCRGVPRAAGLDLGAGSRPRRSHAGGSAANGLGECGALLDAPGVGCAGGSAGVESARGGSRMTLSYQVLVAIVECQDGEPSDDVEEWTMREFGELADAKAFAEDVYSNNAPPDPDAFALAYPPSPQKQWRGEPTEQRRQKVLLAGMDCQPGQLDLFQTDGDNIQEV